jgi:branched-chain amino acid transport system permease protein
MPMELAFFIEVLVAGLLSGVMYSLVALGFVLIFKASGVLISPRVRWYCLLR